MNSPVNTIVRLRHPRSGDSQGQGSFLAPSADDQITTMITMTYIYIYIYIYTYVYYKKCYQHQLLKYRRSIFTEQKGFTECHVSSQIYKAKLKNELAPSRKKTQCFSYYIIFRLSSKLSGLRP